LRRSALWFPFLLLIVVQALFMVRADSPIRKEALWGTDGYMRLVRVENLARTGEWFNGTIARANTPYGDTLHWTRPMDVVLLAGAAPLIPILGLKPALYWWGAFVGPVLHWLTLFALLWAARPLFKNDGLVYLGVVSLAQPVILSYYAVGRPDHHSLIGLLFVVFLGFGLRLIIEPGTQRNATYGGIIAALGVWVSVEFLLPLAIFLTAMGIAWIALRETYAKAGATFCTRLTLALFVALAIERAGGAPTLLEFDRLSFVHVYLMALLAVFFLLAAAIEARTGLAATPVRRVALSAVGGGLVVAVLARFFPDFFAGPFANVDPRVISVWFNDTSEVRPLLNPQNPLKSLREAFFHLGPVLLGGPFLWLLWRREAGPARRGWALIALALAVFVPMALYQARWSTYAEFLFVLPYAALVIAILDQLDRGGLPATRNAQMARAAARGAVVAGMATLFLLLAVLVYKAEDHGPKGPGCRLSDMAALMGTEPALAMPPKRIMSLVYYGPEIIYRSRHSVVGTPYQRNRTGILDTVNFFSDTGGETASGIARQRGLDQVMICLHAGEGKWYRTKDGEPDSLYEKLSANDPPAWLSAVTLPDRLSGAFRLYAVNKAALQ